MAQITGPRLHTKLNSAALVRRLVDSHEGW